MSVRTVFRKEDDLGLMRYRLTKPENAEGWEEVNAGELEVKERIDLRLDTRSDEWEQKIRDLERQVDDLSAKLVARAASQTETVAGKPELISMCRLFRAIATKDWGGADLEHHAVHCDEARALATHLDSTGGYIVPESYLGNEFIELLRANQVTANLGLRRLTNLRTSPVVLPKQSGGATHYWVGENASITDSTQTLAQLRLSPHKGAALTKIPNELIMMADPNAEQFVREDLAMTLGIGADLAILKGTGASNEPLGVMATTGVTTSTMTGLFNYDKAYDLLYFLEAENAARGNMAFVSHPRHWNQARKTADTSSYPKTNSGIGAPFTMDMDGMPFHTTTQLTAGEMVFGNWSDLIVAEWAGIMFLASQHAGDAFQYDQTWIRATQLMDVGVRHDASFVKATALSATG